MLDDNEKVRFQMHLTVKEARALGASARDNLREFRAQARYLLAEVLQSKGYLPAGSNGSDLHGEEGQRQARGSAEGGRR